MNLKTLSAAYLEATEWNMATLEELLAIKSSSKHRINRQKSICTKMLTVCLVMDPEVLAKDIPRSSVRTQKILAQAKSGKSLAEILDEYVAEAQS